MLSSVSKASQPFNVTVDISASAESAQHPVIVIPVDSNSSGVSGPQAQPSPGTSAFVIDIPQTLGDAQDFLGTSAEASRSVELLVAGATGSQGDALAAALARLQGLSLETALQGFSSVAQYLQTQLRDTLDSLPRPLSNLLVSCAFNLPSVSALTFARGTLSTAVASSISGTAAVISGAAVSAVPLLLTLAATGHHLYNGTATPAYLASQGAFLAVSVAILGAALATGPATIFAGLAGSAPAVALYCLCRDLLQPFHGLGSNTGLSLPVNLVDGVIYGTLQFAAGAVGLATDSALTAAVINGLIESVEPVLNEQISAWWRGRDEGGIEESFRLDFNVQMPGWEQIVNRLKDTGIPRMMAFTIINVGAAVAHHIGATGLSDSQNAWLVNGIGALLAAYILVPFYQSHDRPPSAPSASTDIELTDVRTSRL